MFASLRPEKQKPSATRREKRISDVVSAITEKTSGATAKTEEISSARAKTERISDEILMQARENRRENSRKKEKSEKARSPNLVNARKRKNNRRILITDIFCPRKTPKDAKILKIIFLFFA